MLLLRPTVLISDYPAVTLRSVHLLRRRLRVRWHVTLQGCLNLTETLAIRPENSHTFRVGRAAGRLFS